MGSSCVTILSLDFQPLGWDQCLVILFMAFNTMSQKPWPSVFLLMVNFMGFWYLGELPGRWGRRFAWF